MSKTHLRYKNQTRRERTLTIHLISLEKTVKATLLIVVAFRLLSLFDQDVHLWASEFVTRHGIDITNRYVHSALERLIGVGNSQIITWSSIAFFYSGLLLVEALGLWFQKRWAEYLTTISTALFIPVEIHEVFERFTWIRVGVLLVNIFIVWYLATRLRDEKVEIVERTNDAVSEAL